MITKKEYSASDAAPVVLYAKTDVDSQSAYPVLITSSGTVKIDGNVGIAGYRSSDATYQPLRIDKATNSIQTIEYEHHEIHAGSMFGTWYHADKTIGANLDILFTTPNTTAWAHMVIQIEHESETDMLVYEGVSAITGTSLAVYNRDRNNTKTSGVLFWHTPTSITTGTTTIFGWHEGGGKLTGGGNRSDSEKILKQNTSYLLRATATAAGWIAVRFIWYDHTNIA